MRNQLAFVLLVAAGCGGAGPAPPPEDMGPRSSFTEDEAAAARAACMFKQGTAPGLSLAKTAPLGSQIPIDTIVIVMMENRSFDHVLGNLPAYGQPAADVAPADATNPDLDGNPVARYHLTEMCFGDTDHEWSASHLQWNDGKNDGFVKTNYEGGNPGSRAMGYYTEADLPFLYSVANAFAIGDRYFCSLLGPTFPNREYLYGASSFGHLGSELFYDPTPNLVQSLVDTNVSWWAYYTSLPGPGIFLDTVTAHLDRTDHVDQFFVDAAAGALSHVNFVDAQIATRGNAKENDFHPPGDVQLGDQFLDQVTSAVMASPQWPHTALFITFDEHGGIYDHVPPPPACPPDDIAPMLGTNDPPGKFDRLGFRVPLIVVSPYAKPHYVSHKVYDHTSITRFVETRFLLPALTARDANADPLFDLFDFSQPRLLTPPELATSVVDAQKLADCVARFPVPTAADAFTLPDASHPVDAGSSD